MDINSTEYKLYHEAYMTNNNGTSAFHTFCCILFTVLCSLYCSIGDNGSSLSRHVYEYFVIVIPLISAHTLLSEYIYLLNIMVITILVFEFTYHYPKLEISKKFAEQNHFSDKIKSVSLLRGLTYLITVYCVLAVDFKDFPRHLAKTERYGYSLMDTGVGLFVLMSGLVHKDVNKHNYKTIIKNNMRFVTVLVFLGIGRVISVKYLNYQEHITEYGIHWNFFFTLAVCKLISTILLFLSSKALLVSIFINLTHEYMLYNSLESWVFSDAPRDNIISANREGVCSCLGYVSLYLFAVHVRNTLRDKSTIRYLVLRNLIIDTIAVCLLSYITNMYRPASRTLANASYCLYLEFTLLSIISLLYVIEVLFHDKTHNLYFDIPIIISAINNNGLLYFLLANILTGFVNLSVRTLFVSSLFTFVILNVYMIVTLAIVAYLKAKNIRI